MTGKAVVAIEDDATWMSTFYVSDGELGIVYPGRPGTHEYSVKGRPYPVDPPQVSVTADPLTVSGRRRDSSIEGLRNFQHHPGPLRADVVDEGPIERAGPYREGSDQHGNPCLFEGRKPASLNAFIGVLGGCYHATDTGLKNGFGAGGCLAVVTAGLEGDVQGGTVAASGVSTPHGIFQGNDLGVVPAVRLMPPLAQYLLGRIIHDEGPNERVWTYEPRTTSCECERPSHPVYVAL